MMDININIQHSLVIPRKKNREITIFCYVYKISIPTAEKYKEIPDYDKVYNSEVTVTLRIISTVRIMVKISSSLSDFYYATHSIFN